MCWNPKVSSSLPNKRIEMLSFVKDRKKNAAPGSEANLFMDQGQEFSDFFSIYQKIGRHLDILARLAEGHRVAPTQIPPGRWAPWQETGRASRGNHVRRYYGMMIEASSDSWLRGLGQSHFRRTTSTVKEASDCPATHGLYPVWKVCPLTLTISDKKIFYNEQNWNKIASYTWIKYTINKNKLCIDLL